MLTYGIDKISQKKNASYNIHTIGFSTHLTNMNIVDLLQVKQKFDTYSHTYPQENSTERIDEFLTTLENIGMKFEFDNLRESIVKDIFIANFSTKYSFVKRSLQQESDLTHRKSQRSKFKI